MSLTNVDAEYPMSGTWIHFNVCYHVLAWQMSIVAEMTLRTVVNAMLATTGWNIRGYVERNVARCHSDYKCWLHPIHASAKQVQSGASVLKGASLLQFDIQC